jgi:serine/threonine protein kinase
MPLPKLPGSDAKHWAQVQARKVSEDQSSASSQPIFNAGTMRFQRGKLLGSGSFGKVYQCFDLSSGQLIAVKQIELLNQQMRRVAKQAQTEINLMQKLNHANIVQLLGSHITQDRHTNIETMNIIMEFIPGKCLSDILREFGAFPENICQKYITQMLLALEHCHQSNIVHRDIKGQNILMSANSTVKLCDFGSAKILDNILNLDEKTQSFTYTPLFAAPEVFSSKLYNYKVDIWSLGCVLIEMATAQPPWAEKDLDRLSVPEALRIISSGRERPGIPEHLSYKAKHFISQCLTLNAHKRPSATELLLHPFITQGGANGTNNAANQRNHTSAKVSSSSNSDSNMNNLSYFRNNGQYLSAIISTEEMISGSEELSNTLDASPKTSPPSRYTEATTVYHLDLEQSQLRDWETQFLRNESPNSNNVSSSSSNSSNGNSQNSSGNVASPAASAATGYRQPEKIRSSAVAAAAIIKPRTIVLKRVPPA